LRARSNASEKVLAFVVELVEIVAEKKFAEAVDGKDRRLQIVRQNAEKAQELVGRDRLLDCLILFFQCCDLPPPASCAGCNL
jgi:hypothetical protein